LDDLNVMALGFFKGKIWEGKTKASMAIFTGRSSKHMRFDWSGPDSA
jgi:hypothetical protein